MLFARNTPVALRRAPFATDAPAVKAPSRRSALPNIVLIDAVRTPFAVSGTVYKDLMGVDLQRQALKGLADRTQVPLTDVGYICAGMHIQECYTGNIARDAAVGAGYPESIPAHTITLGCISANAAAASIIGWINSGYMDVGIAGGVEFTSDGPIRYNRTARSAMIEFAKAKSFRDRLKHGVTIAKELVNVDFPVAREYSTGEDMGTSCDRLAAAFGVSRR
ncbi:hydroxyacyl dehydrogenase [Aphelenchoides avenae]|nr:hydroxyacyl dehydrogenase [Aphelenchus avenae]